VDDTQFLFFLIQILEKGNRAGFIRLDVFPCHLGMLYETIEFALLDPEMADENDWFGHGILLPLIVNCGKVIIGRTQANTRGDPNKKRAKI
jgi:hypothetical protein